ncbi:MAG: hypothetical protein ACTHLE_16465 [Agriterribacter sp.]
MGIRKLLMSSLALIVFSISLVIFQLSCKKETTAQTATLTKDEILVAKNWKIDQLHSVIDGTYAMYSNGGTNTTGVDYHNVRYTFNADGTGTYVDQYNDSYAITWQFTSADKRSIKFTRSGKSPDNWEMVEIADKYLHATQNFTVGSNTNNLHSFRLVQIP